MQGGQSSCFHEAASVFFFSCSSVCSAPPQARWGNSGLNAALCPRVQVPVPPPEVLWEISLSLCSLSQPLCLSQTLLGSRCSSKWLACWPALIHSLCCFMTCHCEFGAVSSVPYSTPDSSAVRDQLYVPPCSQSWLSIPPQTLMPELDYTLLFMVFSFAGRVQSAMGLCWIIFLRWVGEPRMVHDAHHFLLQFDTGSFVASWWEKMA
jgi:hypothetical protein